MTEEMMSLDEVAKECKEAAEYLASQPGEGYDLDTLTRDKNLEFENPYLKPRSVSFARMKSRTLNASPRTSSACRGIVSMAIR